LLNTSKPVYQRHGSDTSILDGITAADGSIELEPFAVRYFGQPAPIYNVFAKRTLIAAVARALNPGCQADTALVLQSAQQGFKKTSFFRTLASPDWFDDSLGNASDKDERLKLHRTWFAEWGEIEAIFKRREIGQTKQFMTSVADNLRPPYGREVERMPRHSVICGTTNQDEFLSDPTGSRRFWVVPLRKPIDIQRLEQNAIASGLRQSPSTKLGSSGT
jgi:predicted P-loop ATPase